MARDCQAWRDSGMPLTTTSDMACKLLDAAVQQLVDRRVQVYGDLEKIMVDLKQADPDFVMGSVLEFAMLLSAVAHNMVASEITSRVAHLQGLLDKQADTLTAREKHHAASVLYIAKGLWREGMDELVAILTEHPRDMLALKFLYLYTIYTGNFEEMRDVMARILPAWREGDMEYGFLLGMYAFVLEETHFYEKGTRLGLQALDLNRTDSWATHTLAHCYLMTGQNDTGMDLMTSTVADWQDDGLSCHNWWHCALFHVEKGDFNSALELYDKEVSRRALTDKTMFQMTDGVSLLYRLKLEGIEVGAERWRGMVDLCEPHIGDHAQCFTDAHMVLATCAAQRDDLSVRMLDSMKTMVKGEKNYVQQTTAKANLPLCEAIAAYERGEFAQAVDYLRPVRYQYAPIGGSAAQRDVFNLLLIHSGLKSDRVEHQKYARQLLLERKSLQQDSPMADRLLARVLASHTH